MKLLLPLALLLAGTARAIGRDGLPERNPPRGKATKTENFAWSNPFASGSQSPAASGDKGGEGDGSSPGDGLAPACTAERTFAAAEFLLHDLFESEPTGLRPYADALRKGFSGRPYPGGWDGMDPHMYDRPLLRMDYAVLPLAVRQWIEHQESSDGPGKGLFAVYERAVADEDGEAGVAEAAATATPPSPDKADDSVPPDQKRIVVFAPGALYDILPLWVAEGSRCRGRFARCGGLLSRPGKADAVVARLDSLADLARYSPQPKDGGVIAVSCPFWLVVSATVLAMSADRA